MNSSAERSQTARPSRLANGFFSLSLNRADWPAAGRITLNLAMLRLAGNLGGDRLSAQAARLAEVWPTPAQVYSFYSAIPTEKPANLVNRSFSLIGRPLPGRYS